MILAVVGSRTWKDWLTIRRTIHEIKPDEIVSGGASGADHMARDVAYRDSYLYTEFKPEWKKYGRKAGAIRNKKIVDYCDKLVAFWDGKSKGTKISIEMAKAEYKLLKVVYEYDRIASPLDVQAFETRGKL